MIVVLLLLTLAVVVFLAVAARKYWTTRGVRLVTCPENRATAAVEMDAARAALLLPGGALRLRDCSRWPEKKGCGQECLAQIESAPENCLVRNVLAQWYRGKSCVVCGRAFGEIHWTDRKPALVDPEGNTLDWQSLVPETIPETLAGHLPVCFDCHVAETFRRLYPNLVIDRPWDRSGADPKN